MSQIQHYRQLSRWYNIVTGSWTTYCYIWFPPIFWWRIWNQITKLKFQWMLRKQKILNSRGTNEEIMCFPRWETSKNRGRGSFEGTLEHIVSKHIQHISFLIWILGDFTGYSRSAFPYLLASKDDQSIYSAESVPTGFVLGDPDHLNSFQINELYNHWLSRQNKCLPPFVVLNAGPLHQPSLKKSQKSDKAKGKGKMKYIEVDESVEDGDEDGDDEVV